MSDFREQIRQELLASYKHRSGGAAACALCGSKSRPLAFHMLESSFNEGSALPNEFVPMSASMGRVRGSFPICDSCAPPCKKCRLPIPAERVMELGHRLNATNGNGVCQDIQIVLLVGAVFKRLFGLGRFANKSSA